MKKQEVTDLTGNRWREILVYFGVDESFLTGKHTPCPACGGKDRFRFIDKKGRGEYFCSGCNPGDGFDLLMKVKGWSFKQCAEEIRSMLGDDSKPHLTIVKVDQKPKTTPEQERKEIKEYLMTLWKRARPVTAGDPVWKYLVQTRQLPLTKIPGCIRYHPGLKYFDEDKKCLGTFPVMLTAFTGKDGTVASLHRTYLTLEGKKAPVPAAKKATKSCGMHGGAIRLAQAGRRLAVAEGIETAFAVMAFTGMPCWSVYSANLMPHVEIPQEVEEIHVFADNDVEDAHGKKAGQENAAQLVKRLQAEGRKVFLVTPHQPGTDFHDVWLHRLQKEAEKEAKRASNKQAGKRSARKTA